MPTFQSSLSFMLSIMLQSDFLALLNLPRKFQNNSGNFSFDFAGSLFFQLKKVWTQKPPNKNNS